MTSNRFNITTVVHNKEVFFVHYKGVGEDRILYRTSLDAFLDDGFSKQILPDSVRDKKNRLLIVPDFWIENTTYQFQSKKRSMVDAFVERKLQTEHPDLPDIRLFYTYTFLKNGAKDNEVHVSYLEAPESYKVFNRLNAIGLAPQRVTTSAFVWQDRLGHLLSDFQDSGLGFIVTIAETSFLYFYTRGRFLFSRDIVNPESAVDESERYDALVFEINQSIYLFSQKTKSEIKHLIIHDPDGSASSNLSEKLGREVLDFRKLEGNQYQKRESLHEFGPAGAFNEKDVSVKNDYPYVSHKIWQKAREWMPVQSMGIAVGLILFLVLGIGYFFLFKISQTEQIPMGQTVIIGGKAPKMILHEYNSSVDYLLRENQRLSTRSIMIQLARALPENVEMTEVKLEVDPVQKVMLKCTVGVPDMDAFKYKLDELMENLKAYFEGVKQLNKQDVEIQAVATLGRYQIYTMEMNFNLP